MVPRTLRILRIYWSRLQMAEKLGSHCGPAFQIHWGVTQGYPLSPTIFNVVVGACIRDWVVVVGGGGQEGARKGLTVSIQTLLALFCVNDELVASPESASLQGVFDALTGLFDRLGLRTNRGGYGNHGLPYISQPPHLVNRGLQLASEGTGNLL